MPEAPEVQTVLSTLEAQIKDVSIEDVLIYYPKIIDNVEVETFKSQIEFKNISFGYEDQKILDNFSLTIPIGKTVALVGH